MGPLVSFRSAVQVLAGRGAWRVLVLAGCLSACSDDRNPVQPGPVTTFEPLLQAIFPGPLSAVPLGGVRQLTATARYADGTSREVSSDVQWTSSDEAILSIAAGGLATGRATGDVSVSVLFRGMRSGLKPIAVLPEGTVRLYGTVRELGVAGVRVSGARVEVVGGGPATTTDWLGSYALLGAPDGAEVRISKEGFEPVLLNVPPGAGQTPEWRALGADLSRLGERPGFSGAYTLEIAAACPAGSTFPSHLRVRTYSATLRDGRLQLAGASFVVDHQTGKVPPILAWFNDDGVQFHLQDAWDWNLYPSVMEDLGATLYAIAGVARATRTSTGLAGTLDGRFTLYEPQFWNVIDSCTSKSHRFTLTR